MCKYNVLVFLTHSVYRRKVSF